jgi:hypothetical protein
LRIIGSVVQLIDIKQLFIVRTVQRERFRGSSPASILVNERHDCGGDGVTIGKEA